MVKDFHNKPFDDETILKLQIFQGYIREWLPVFLSGKNFNTIYIFDFFAGPGKDLNDQDGSPLIILDEVKKYLSNPKLPHADKVSIHLFFNDDDHDKILSLQKEIASKDKASVKIEITNNEFQQAFNDRQLLLNSSSAAKLIILDQSGIKQITHNTFMELVNFPATDFMFFISSSTLKRFISVGEVKQYFPDMSSEEINEIPATDIHRFVCQYYQKIIPSGKDFFLAPFSIKKRSNIYGIIFGTGILRGLEKFLKVCWNKDSISGEANYDIDDDILRKGETLFPELNISHKIDLFKGQLFAFLQKYRSNIELYQFTLENGCLPTHTFDILEELRAEKKLEVKPSDTRKRSYYLSWNYYKRREIKAKFRKKMKKSRIEWTESTWNPVTGCTKISAGCLHCYAERMARRLKAMGQKNYCNGFKVTCHPHVLDAPLKWKRTQMVFVNSMSDLFHKDVPYEFILDVFVTMGQAQQHQFQVLTKRAERLAELSPGLSWSENIWMGVTVESADYKYRVDYLRYTGANIKFLSFEPLLSDLGELNLDEINWVIVGGESGPGARPMEIGWVRSIREQCIAQNVPFFFKQWGGTNKKKAGRLLDGETWDGMPIGFRDNMYA